MLTDSRKKSLGVILPSPLVFNTGIPEIVYITVGTGFARIKGIEDWASYGAGQSLKLPGNSSFEIEATYAVDYVCHCG